MSYLVTFILLSVLAACYFTDSFYALFLVASFFAGTSSNAILDLINARCVK